MCRVCNVFFCMDLSMQNWLGRTRFSEHYPLISMHLIKWLCFFGSLGWSIVLEGRCIRSWSWSCSERMCQYTRARRRTLLSSLSRWHFRSRPCLLGRLRSRRGRPDYEVPATNFSESRCGRNPTDHNEVLSAKLSREEPMSEQSKRDHPLTHFAKLGREEPMSEQSKRDHPLTHFEVMAKNALHLPCLCEGAPRFSESLTFNSYNSLLILLLHSINYNTSSVFARFLHLLDFQCHNLPLSFPCQSCPRSSLLSWQVLVC